MDLVSNSGILSIELDSRSATVTTHNISAAPIRAATSQAKGGSAVKTKNLVWGALLAATIAGCGGGADQAATTQAPVAVEEPIRTGASIAKPLMGVALVGKSYEDLISIVTNDSRNPVATMAIENPTAGGAAATVDLAGLVKWSPNAADLQTTLQLRVRAVLKNGEVIEVNAPVRVQREVLVFEATFAGADGSYSDPDGRYLIKASRTDAVRPIVGKMRVYEYHDKNGLISWSVDGEATAGTVKLTVLNAPVVPSKKAQESLSLQADSDHPLIESRLSRLEFEELAMSRMGSVIREGTDVYSSRETSTYSRIKNDVPKVWTSTSIQVFNFLDSCANDVTACRQKAKTKAPIVLIHGFAGLDSNFANDDITGGGSGTWGDFAKRLIEKGHPVFEMRWHTYMRFEEAAGVLAKYTEAVSKYTHKKPIVVAHSFGGVVAHLALQSNGIEYSGSGWRPVPYKNQIAKLITLNSPLGGINHPSGSLDRSDFEPSKVVSQGTAFSMTRGRDHTDQTIGGCYAITCLQAGALFPQNNNNGMQLKVNVALIAGEESVVYDTRLQPESVTTGSGQVSWEGESIKRLQDGLANMRTPVLRFAGFQNLSVTSSNELLGDGLISLIGMAVLPENFASNPYNKKSEFGYKFIGTAKHSLYKKGNAETKAFNELVAGDCFSYASSPHQYIICARSAHTGIKRLFEVDFSIADTSSIDDGIAHPLLTLMDDSSWIAAMPEDSPEFENLLAMAPESTFVWRAFVTIDGAPSYFRFLPARVKVTRKTTGAVVLDSVIAGDLATTTYRFNLGRALTRELGAIPDLSQFSMTLQMGGGVFLSRFYNSYYQEFSNLFGIQIIDPHIDLTLRPLANISGHVIDGQTISTPVSGATIYLAKGTDRSAAYLKDIPIQGTKVTRRLTANSAGAFSTDGLEAGNYSVLVTKDGYTDELQGRVTIETNSQLSFNLLRVLSSGEASITLRWANSSAGSNVEPDLDSHLLRFSANGTIDYHIFHARRTVPGLIDSLDRDDTDFEGPETITLKLEAGKNYTYYVHNYSGRGTIVQSFPRVYLRIGATTESFAPPSIQGSPKYWRVFDFVNGALRSCRVDCLVDVPPSGISTQSSAGQISPDVWDRLTSLPAK